MSDGILFPPLAFWCGVIAVWCAVMAWVFEDLPHASDDWPLSDGMTDEEAAAAVMLFALAACC